MAICEVSGKGKMYGHNISFSERHTRKVFKPNVKKRTLVIDGKKVRLNISTSALRTLKKKGLITAPQAKKSEQKVQKSEQKSAQESK